MSIIIAVENLGKKYTISHRQREDRSSLRDALASGLASFGRRLLHPFKPSPRAPAFEDFWALKDVSFEVKQGERIGIIGRNGAGKSTLLKILSRITEPTTGRVKMKGRVASLLEVGTGFHPELTGRENIFLNGAILGMSRQEIGRKFDEIVDFSEIEKFLDTPVKRYSSGMYVRLAFAVAAHLEPEILIVDEVLAVGDAAFQKKCLGKMEEAGSEGRTIIFVSHNMGAIHSLTRKCIFLENGAMPFYGDTHSAVERYLTSSQTVNDSVRQDLDCYRADYVVKANESQKKVRYSDIWTEHDDQRQTVLDMGEPFTVFLELEAYAEISGANLSFCIFNSEFRCVTVVFSWDENFYLDLSPGRHTISLEIGGLVLPPGKYYAGTGVNQSTESVAWDVIANLPLFEVVNSGKIVHWLHRNWGSVHCDVAQWRQLISNRS